MKSISNDQCDGTLIFLSADKFLFTSSNDSKDLYIILSHLTLALLLSEDLPLVASWNALCNENY